VSGYSELKWCGKEVRLFIIVPSIRLFVPYKEGGKCTCGDELQENGLQTGELQVLFSSWCEES